MARELERPNPRIFVKGSIKECDAMFLSVEHQIFCTVKNCSVVDATLGVIAICYVFMYNYPIGLNNFYVYLQQCLLQIKDGKKLPISVVKFIDEPSKAVSTA